MTFAALAIGALVINGERVIKRYLAPFVRVVTIRTLPLEMILRTGMA